MILENVTVKEAKEIWRSPDGQRTISELKLDYQGNTITAKTYSKNLTLGWSGNLESYEKPGRNGVETFVKQPPKEGGFPSSGKGKDDAAIQAMWSITKAVEWLTSAQALDADITSIEPLAIDFYKMVDKVKAATSE
jgi:hypothetical protein